MKATILLTLRYAGLNLWRKDVAIYSGDKQGAIAQPLP